MSATYTRRDVLALSASAALTAGCRTQKPVAPSLVSIVRAAGYDQSLYGTMRSLFREHKVEVRGRKVVIKPNLVEFESGECVNAHPVVVHTAMEAVRAMGAAEVHIAEGPANRRNTLDLADAAAYFQTIPRFEDVFVDLNLDDVTAIRLNHAASRLKKLYLPNTVLGADLVVSLAKMKTHRWAGVTLSMKNLFGVVPGAVYGWPKNILHWAGIPECIVDLHGIFPRQFAIVDGIVGMEGNGPLYGDPKRMNLLVAGSDPVAVDATCCRIMGIDPLKVAYMRYLARRGNAYVGDANVRQIGESIADVAARFRPPATLPNLSL